MEYKNRITLFIVLSLCIGIFIGLLIGTNKKNSVSVPENMHMMGNGEMMHNEKMSMHDMMGSMMLELEGKTGNEFDKAFLSEMIVHHQGAVVMAEAVLEKSQRPELITLARDIISAQTKEIEMMKGWQKMWFKQN